MALITDFISNVKSIGLARTNRYTVRVLPPQLVSFTSSSSTNQIVTLFCDSVDLPGMSIATTPHRVFGEVREMPYDRMFNTASISFYSDSNLNIRGLFERWIHTIMNQKARTIEYYSNYIGTVHIRIDNVDESMSSPYEITLHEVYPKSIDQIQLNASSKEILKVNVVLQYKYWTSSASDAWNNEAISPYVGGQDPQGIQTGAGTTTQFEQTTYKTYGQ